MVYQKTNNVTIRSMQAEDAQIIYDKYLSYGWHADINIYLNYFKEQSEKKRLVFIAEHEGSVAGLCTLVLKPVEGLMGNTGIPEIVDLGVFMEVRNKGIGNLLLDTAEMEAGKISNKVYLAVGLHKGYGAAQRIYVKRGYIPDGSGIWYENKQLEEYAECKNDDDLVLFFYKDLVQK